MAYISSSHNNLRVFGWNIEILSDSFLSSITNPLSV
jgi:hypothetical protein